MVGHKGVVGVGNVSGHVNRQSPNSNSTGDAPNLSSSASPGNPLLVMIYYSVPEAKLSISSQRCKETADLVRTLHDHITSDFRLLVIS